MATISSSVAATLSMADTERSLELPECVQPGCGQQSSVWSNVASVHSGAILHRECIVWWVDLQYLISLNITLILAPGIQGSYVLYNWYSTSFTVPSDWSGDRVLLNFGAVDYEATVFVNGQKAGFNRGGYFAFSIDITDYLSAGANELLVVMHKFHNDIW